MGWRDELCCLSGLKPGGGPRMLFSDLDTCLNQVMNGIALQDLSLSLSEEQLRNELRSLFLLFEDPGESKRTTYETSILDGSIPTGPYFPFDSEEWDGWKAIAVGIFDEPRLWPLGPGDLSYGYVSYG
jgi:hypothetical protein